MLSAYDMLNLEEGLRYRAYKDTTGHITVGIGFNMDNPTAKAIWLRADIPESFNAVYTQQSVLSTNSVVKLLNTCVDNCRIDLESVLLRDVQDMPTYVQLALINLMFNLGKSVFSQFTTFIDLIKTGNYNDASIDLGTTLWSKELPLRSQRVVALLQGDCSHYLQGA